MQVVASYFSLSNLILFQKKIDQLPSIDKINDEQEEIEQGEDDCKLPKNNHLTRKCSATTVRGVNLLVY